MNFLGHLVLSGQCDDTLFGNFIADVIKGKAYLNWPKNIQNGVLLHRKIDEFTDSNPHYLKSKRRFYSDFPKMGGVITDIVYDYLLWQYELKYQSLNLEKEIIRYYNVLDSYYDKMPSNIQLLYHYMKKDDWLSNYQSEWGIKRALNGIGKRINYSNDLEKSFQLVKSNINLFENEFYQFFIMIKAELNHLSTNT